MPVARPQLRDKGAHGAIPQFLRSGGYSCVHCLLLLVHNNRCVCSLIPTAMQLARARHLYRAQSGRAQEHTQRVSGAPAWVCARKETMGRERLVGFVLRYRQGDWASVLGSPRRRGVCCVPGCACAVQPVCRFALGPGQGKESPGEGSVLSVPGLRSGPRPLRARGLRCAASQRTRMALRGEQNLRMRGQPGNLARTSTVSVDVRRSTSATRSFTSGSVADALDDVAVPGREAAASPSAGVESLFAICCCSSTAAAASSSVATTGCWACSCGAAASAAGASAVSLSRAIATGLRDRGSKLFTWERDATWTCFHRVQCFAETKMGLTERQQLERALRESMAQQGGGGMQEPEAPPPLLRARVHTHTRTA